MQWPFFPCLAGSPPQTFSLSNYIPPNPNNVWFRATMPYVENAQIFVCPSDGEKDSAKWNETGNHWDQSDEFPLSYCINSHLTGSALAQIQYPSETGMFMDAEGCARAYESTSWCARCYAIAEDRHNNGFNASLVDGHAKWYNADDEDVFNLDNNVDD